MLIARKRDLVLYKTLLINIARCPVWVWNLVADIEGGT